jgi:spoIIIJ-associated protein
MQTIETTAKTPEEAIELALKELDVDREEVEVDVVSRGKPGILGIGSEPAKVRVTVLESPTDTVKVATSALNQLISGMGVAAVAHLRQAQSEGVGGPVFDIDGDDSGLLIGRRGETLRALHFLVNLIAGAQLGENPSIQIDVAGYMDRRYKSLTNLALNIASRVAGSGQPITLEPMPPNERRAVHVALAEHQDVTTESIGAGDGRQVVVRPRSEQQDSYDGP